MARANTGSILPGIRGDDSATVLKGGVELLGADRHLPLDGATGSRGIHELLVDRQDVHCSNLLC